MEIRQTLVLDSSEPLSKAIPQLDEEPAVIVTKNGRYYGIIDHRCLVMGAREPTSMKCETATVKPPVIMQGMGIVELVDAFLGGHFKALPVVDSKEMPLGITTRVELLKDLMVEDLIPKMNVADIMNSPVFTVEENESIGSAKNMLREKNAHRLVVTRKGILLGIVSSYDLEGWSARPNLSGGKKDIRQPEPVKVDSMPISNFLRPDATLLEQSATAFEAVERMVQKGVSSVIVVSGKKPVGVVSALDIFKKVRESAQGSLPIAISGLSEDDISEYSEITEKMGHILGKFSGTLGITNCSIHIKSGKSVYQVHVVFDTNEGQVSLKTEGGALKETIDHIATEVETILRKKKDMRKIKPRGTHAD